MSAARSSSRHSGQPNIVATCARTGPIARSVASYVARLSPVSRFVVADESMLPAYGPRDRVAVNRLAYVVHGPRSGDAVVLRDPEMPSRYLLKRVLAQAPDAGGATCYQLLGDNAAYSRDSRAFGPVPRSAIVGKVWFKY